MYIHIYEHTRCRSVTPSVRDGRTRRRHPHWAHWWREGTTRRHRQTTRRSRGRRLVSRRYAAVLREWWQLAEPRRVLCCEEGCDGGLRQPWSPGWGRPRARPRARRARPRSSRARPRTRTTCSRAGGLRRGRARYGVGMTRGGRGGRWEQTDGRAAAHIFAGGAEVDESFLPSSDVSERRRIIEPTSTWSASGGPSVAVGW